MNENELKQLQSPPALSEIEIEWKRLHDRHGHIAFPEMDKLVAHGILPKKFEVVKGKCILCPSCIFGKMRKRAWRVKGKRSGKICKEKYPGAKVSTDQLVVAQPGLVPRMDGRHTNERICGATGFFDHYSGYSYSALQTSLDGDQTLVAKLSFESHALTSGVEVKSYRADNGRFAEQSFLDAVKEAHQTIGFCAVGAHHQNGVIERHFQRLTTSARTILLHAKRHWSSMITTVLWPFAYKYAELLYNHLHVDALGLSPAEKFCNTPVKLEVNNFHTWGCPCYVLDARGQNGNMIPKWDPRSRLGIYVGHSPCHARSVALVLNPKTLYVSPQYHVAFDDDFSTVPFLASTDVPPNWAALVSCSESSTDLDYDLAEVWIQAQGDPTTPPPDQEGEVSVERRSAKIVSFDDESVPLDSEGAAENKNVEILMQPTLPDINDFSGRKSSRKSKPTDKAKESKDPALK